MHTKFCSSDVYIYRISNFFNIVKFHSTNEIFFFIFLIYIHNVSIYSQNSLKDRVKSKQEKYRSNLIKHKTIHFYLHLASSKLINLNRP